MSRSKSLLCCKQAAALHSNFSLNSKSKSCTKTFNQENKCLFGDLLERQEQRRKRLAELEKVNYESISNSYHVDNTNEKCFANENVQCSTLDTGGTEKDNCLCNDEHTNTLTRYSHSETFLKNTVEPEPVRSATSSGKRKCYDNFCENSEVRFATSCNSKNSIDRFTDLNCLVRNDVDVARKTYINKNSCVQELPSKLEPTESKIESTKPGLFSTLLAYSKLKLQHMFSMPYESKTPDHGTEVIETQSYDSFFCNGTPETVLKGTHDIFNQPCGKILIGSGLLMNKTFERSFHTDFSVCGNSSNIKKKSEDNADLTKTSLKSRKSVETFTLFVKKNNFTSTPTENCTGTNDIQRPYHFPKNNDKFGEKSNLPFQNLKYFQDKNLYNECSSTGSHYSASEINKKPVFDKNIAQTHINQYEKQSNFRKIDPKDNLKLMSDSFSEYFANRCQMCKAKYNNEKGATEMKKTTVSDFNKNVETNDKCYLLLNVSKPKDVNFKLSNKIVNEGRYIHLLKNKQTCEPLNNKEINVNVQKTENKSPTNKLNFVVLNDPSKTKIITGVSNNKNVKLVNLKSNYKNKLSKTKNMFLLMPEKRSIKLKHNQNSCSLALFKKFGYITKNKATIRKNPRTGNVSNVKINSSPNVNHSLSSLTSLKTVSFSSKKYGIKHFDREPKYDWKKDKEMHKYHHFPKMKMIQLPHNASFLRNFHKTRNLFYYKKNFRKNINRDNYNYGDNKKSSLLYKNTASNDKYNRVMYMMHKFKKKSGYSRNYNNSNQKFKRNKKYSADMFRVKLLGLPGSKTSDIKKESEFTLVNRKSNNVKTPSIDHYSTGVPSFDTYTNRKKKDHLFTDYFDKNTIINPAEFYRNEISNQKVIRGKHLLKHVKFDPNVNNMIPKQKYLLRQLVIKSKSYFGDRNFWNSAIPFNYKIHYRPNYRKDRYESEENQHSEDNKYSQKNPNYLAKMFSASKNKNKIIDLTKSKDPVLLPISPSDYVLKSKNPLERSHAKNRYKNKIHRIGRFNSKKSTYVPNFSKKNYVFPIKYKFERKMNKQDFHVALDRLKRFVDLRNVGANIVGKIHHGESDKQSADSDKVSKTNPSKELNVLNVNVTIKQCLDGKLNVKDSVNTPEIKTTVAKELYTDASKKEKPQTEDISKSSYKYNALMGLNGYKHNLQKRRIALPDTEFSAPVKKDMTTFTKFVRKIENNNSLLKAGLSGGSTSKVTVNNNVTMNTVTQNKKPLKALVSPNAVPQSLKPKTPENNHKLRMTRITNSEPNDFQSVVLDYISLEFKKKINLIAKVADENKDSSTSKSEDKSSWSPILKFKHLNRLDSSNRAIQSSNSNNEDEKYFLKEDLNSKSKIIEDSNHSQYGKIRSLKVTDLKNMNRTVQGTNHRSKTMNKKKTTSIIDKISEMANSFLLLTSNITAELNATDYEVTDSSSTSPEIKNTKSEKSTYEPEEQKLSYKRLSGENNDGKDSTNFTSRNSDCTIDSSSTKLNRKPFAYSVPYSCTLNTDKKDNKQDSYFIENHNNIFVSGKEKQYDNIGNSRIKNSFKITDQPYEVSNITYKNIEKPSLNMTHKILDETDSDALSSTGTCKENDSANRSKIPSIYAEKYKVKEISEQNENKLTLKTKNSNKSKLELVSSKASAKESLVDIQPESIQIDSEDTILLEKGISPVVQNSENLTELIEKDGDCHYTLKYNMPLHLYQSKPDASRSVENSEENDVLNHNVSPNNILFESVKTDSGDTSKILKHPEEVCTANNNVGYCANKQQSNCESNERLKIEIDNHNVNDNLNILKRTESQTSVLPCDNNRLAENNCNNTQYNGLDKIEDQSDEKVMMTAAENLKVEKDDYVNDNTNSLKRTESQTSRLSCDNSRLAENSYNKSQYNGIKEIEDNQKDLKIMMDVAKNSSALSNKTALDKILRSNKKHEVILERFSNRNIPLRSGKDKLDVNYLDDYGKNKNEDNLSETAKTENESTFIIDDKVKDEIIYLVSNTKAFINNKMMCELKMKNKIVSNENSGNKEYVSKACDAADLPLLDSNKDVSETTISSESVLQKDKSLPNDYRNKGKQFKMVDKSEETVPTNKKSSGLSHLNWKTNRIVSDSLPTRKEKMTRNVSKEQDETSKSMIVSNSSATVKEKTTRKISKEQHEAFKTKLVSDSLRTGKGNMTRKTGNGRHEASKAIDSLGTEKGNMTRKVGKEQHEASKTMIVSDSLATGKENVTRKFSKEQHKVPKTVIVSDTLATGKENMTRKTGKEQHKASKTMLVSDSSATEKGNMTRKIGKEHKASKAILVSDSLATEKGNMTRKICKKQHEASKTMLVSDSSTTEKHKMIRNGKEQHEASKAIFVLDSLTTEKGNMIRKINKQHEASKTMLVSDSSANEKENITRNVNTEQNDTSNTNRNVYLQLMSSLKQSINNLADLRKCLFEIENNKDLTIKNESPEKNCKGSETIFSEPIKPSSMKFDDRKDKKLVKESCKSTTNLLLFGETNNKKCNHESLKQNCVKQNVEQYYISDRCSSNPGDSNSAVQNQTDIFTSNLNLDLAKFVSLECLPSDLVNTEQTASTSSENVISTFNNSNALQYGLPENKNLESLDKENRIIDSRIICVHDFIFSSKARETNKNYTLTKKILNLNMHLGNLDKNNEHNDKNIEHNDKNIEHNDKNNEHNDKNIEHNCLLQSNLERANSVTQSNENVSLNRVETMKSIRENFTNLEVNSKKHSKKESLMLIDRLIHLVEKDSEVIYNTLLTENDFLCKHSEDSVRNSEETIISHRNSSNSKLLDTCSCKMHDEHNHSNECTTNKPNDLKPDVKKLPKHSEDSVRNSEENIMSHKNSSNSKLFDTGSCKMHDEHNHSNECTTNQPNDLKPDVKKLPKHSEDSVRNSEENIMSHKNSSNSKLFDTGSCKMHDEHNHSNECTTNQPNDLKPDVKKLPKHSEDSVRNSEENIMSHKNSSNSKLFDTGSCKMHDEHNHSNECTTNQPNDLKPDLKKLPKHSEDSVRNSEENIMSHKNSSNSKLFDTGSCKMHDEHNHSNECTTNQPNDLKPDVKKLPKHSEDYVRNSEEENIMSYKDSSNSKLFDTSSCKMHDEHNHSNECTTNKPNDLKPDLKKLPKHSKDYVRNSEEENIMSYKDSSNSKWLDTCSCKMHDEHNHSNECTTNKPNDLKPDVKKLPKHSEDYVRNSEEENIMSHKNSSNSKWLDTGSCKMHDEHNHSNECTTNQPNDLKPHVKKLPNSMKINSVNVRNSIQNKYLGNKLKSPSIEPWETGSNFQSNVTRIKNRFGYFKYKVVDSNVPKAESVLLKTKRSNTNSKTVYSDPGRNQLSLCCKENQERYQNSDSIHWPNHGQLFSERTSANSPDTDNNELRKDCESRNCTSLAIETETDETENDNIKSSDNIVLTTTEDKFGPWSQALLKMKNYDMFDVEIDAGVSKNHNLLNELKKFVFKTKNVEEKFSSIKDSFSLTNLKMSDLKRFIVPLVHAKKYDDFYVENKTGCLNVILKKTVTEHSEVSADIESINLKISPAKIYDKLKVIEKHKVSKEKFTHFQSGSLSKMLFTKRKYSKNKFCGQIRKLRGNHQSFSINLGTLCLTLNPKVCATEPDFSIKSFNVSIEDEDITKNKTEVESSVEKFIRLVRCPKNVGPVAELFKSLHFTKHGFENYPVKFVSQINSKMYFSTHCSVPMHETTSSYGKHVERNCVCKKYVSDACLKNNDSNINACCTNPRISSGHFPSKIPLPIKQIKNKRGEHFFQAVKKNNSPDGNNEVAAKRCEKQNKSKTLAGNNAAPSEILNSELTNNSYTSETTCSNDGILKKSFNLTLPLENIQNFPLFNLSRRKLKYEVPRDGVYSLSAFHDQSNEITKTPSVSRILNATMSEKAKSLLNAWKEKMISELGEDGFKAMNEAKLHQGSEFHDCVRQYLLGTPLEELTPHYSHITNLLNSLQRVLPKLTNVAAVESHVIHSQLPYRGIIDCVAEYDGTPVLIEWKHSEKKKKYLQWTYDAPVQMSAYLGAINYDEHYKVPVESGLVVVAYTDGAPADVFLLKQAMCEKYWKMWLARLHQYILEKL